MASSTAARLPTLLIIGGAEDRVGRAALLRRFVRRAGGRRARIVIIPTASGYQDEVVAAYREVFTRLGVSHLRVVNPASREAAGDPELVAHLDDATGVFMTGGSQLRLSQFLPATPAGDAIHRAHARGAVIGGTSAGASIMSEFMISLGEEGLTPRQRTSQLSHGLGLLKGVVIDQHFAQRTRYGRLMSVVAVSPNLIGIGIDEDTAIEVEGGERFTVHGSGGVFVLDCRDAVTDAPEARRGAPLLVSGAVVHQLPAGATFDLRTTTLDGFTERHPDTLVSTETTKA
ncbi:Cyanophycinase [Nostocoides japonicum T1-X7]|uniref:Cyanophycinase n=1 Tax=Nostocoides japonicum T1-X7 TaxID=1194083 RepID=A0A077M6K1_9MICO|nr:cyanophycinase [Tetrasphaera japonica]CCH79660.1 Cyanophycinase [Tetrasphaera japonica T1-X7]